VIFIVFLPELYTVFRFVQQSFAGGKKKKIDKRIPGRCADGLLLLVSIRVS
jgi:hypothetical protein